MITPFSNATVARALSRIRLGLPVTDSRLLHSRAADRHRAQHRLPDDPAGRQAALVDAIRGLVVERLTAARTNAGLPPGIANGVAEGDGDAFDGARLQADFGPDNPDLETWSCLYYRYFAAEPMQIQHMAAVVSDVRSVSSSLVSRRIADGRYALCRLLVDTEAATGVEAATDVVAATAVDRPAPVAAAEAAPDPPDRSFGELRANLDRTDGPLLFDAGEAEHVAARQPADLIEYALTRIATWSAEPFRVHDRYVAPTLTMESIAGAGSQSDRSRQSLSEVLNLAGVQSCVVLGPPGAGKSTLLRRFELDTATGFVRGQSDRVAFYVELHAYGEASDPWRWLQERWSGRYPELPRLADLMAEGRVTLLLDGLNDLRGVAAADYHTRALQWKQFLHGVLRDHPGCRAVISCRLLDYSLPLSKPSEPVPRIVIDALSDEQIRAFVDASSAAHADAIWQALEVSGQRDLVRRPFILTGMLAVGDPLVGTPAGRSALMSQLVRHALFREVQRDNPLLIAGPLLTGYDRLRLVHNRAWQTAHELPDHGLLIPQLTVLATAIHSHGTSGIAVDFSAALGLLDPDVGEAVLKAGVDIDVLDAQLDQSTVSFRHALLLEYFVARGQAARPDAEHARAAWRSDDFAPSAEALIRSRISEPLPGLPTSGWEEVYLMAAEMTADADAFIDALAATNPVLAGRCAAQPVVASRLSETTAAQLRQALVARCGDPAADVRARVEAGLALGDLGDPRLDRGTGPYGPFLLPPMIAIAAGAYRVDDDVAVVPETGAPSSPGTVTLAAFRLGKYPVTNAEWAHFMAAGGYDDSRWWDTRAAQAWFMGHGTADGERRNSHYWRAQFRSNPGELKSFAAQGVLPPDIAERWRGWMNMSDDAFELALVAQFPAGRKTEPQFWRDSRFSNPSQPVVGVSWIEARAYCNWLAAQTGRPFRLPTLAEAVAAASGREGRLYAYGNTFDPLAGQTAETRIPFPAPVGVFPTGETPEGLSDMTGTVCEWVSTAYGPSIDTRRFASPYNAADGREDPDPPSTLLRLNRGGAFISPADAIRATCVQFDYPDRRSRNTGFRLCLSDRPAS